ncbi:MAG TPA: YoaK family protein [Acidimicrobiales bacterium]|nr:YoaK family protein [Acidimicrobiales bacterium]
MVRDTFFADPHHGPLPGLLVGLTVVTGVVDAVSILSLGRVFVANMTGNVVFIGFAAAGAPGFSLSASLVALAGFLVGAAAGGLGTRRFGHDRGVLLLGGATTELVLVGVAFAIAATVQEPFAVLSRDAIAAVAALAMGVQNVVARRLAVPDMTTTVLTMTLTGIVADLRAGSSGWPQLARRFVAVGAMLAGAVVGAVLVLQTTSAMALVVAVALLAAVTLGTAVACRQPGTWRGWRVA